MPPRVGVPPRSQRRPAASMDTEEDRFDDNQQQEEGEEEEEEEEGEGEKEKPPPRGAVRPLSRRSLLTASPGFMYQWEGRAISKVKDQT